MRFRWDGKPVVLGITFPSIAVAIRDVEQALREQRSVVARLRLGRALRELREARANGAVSVPLDALGGLR